MENKQIFNQMSKSEFMSFLKDYYEYFDMLNDFDTIPVENYTLDKVYDKDWFLQDLYRIVKFYGQHGSKHTLMKDLMLWSSFLHGVKVGRYI